MNASARGRLASLTRTECRRVKESLTNAVDGGPVDLALHRHIRECGACRRRLADQRKLAGVLRILQPNVPLPPRVDRRARAVKRFASGAGGIGLASVAALVVREARRRI